MQKHKIETPAFFILGIILGIALTVSVGFENNVQVKPPDIHVNSSNPAPQVYNSVNASFDPPRYNYIQSSNHDIEYEINSAGLKTGSVDRAVILQGSSMRPTIFTGNLALVKNFENQSLEEGDIIETGEFVHRIKADYVDTSGYYVTQGDNNRGVERVKPGEIEGVVYGVLFTDLS